MRAPKTLALRTGLCSVAIILLHSTPCLAASGVSAQHTFTAQNVAGMLPATTISTAAAASEPVAVAYLAPDRTNEFRADGLMGTTDSGFAARGQYSDVPVSHYAAVPVQFEARDTRTFRPFAFLNSMVRSTNACRNALGLGVNRNMGTFLQFRTRC